MYDAIRAVQAREIWDSRGLPTVEVEVRTARGARGRGVAPAGASTGRREAIELRDSTDRLRGRGVRGAVALVDAVVAPALRGLDVADQGVIDAILDGLDPDPQRSHIGGNTTTAVSLAVAHAAAGSAGRILCVDLAGSPIAFLPRPQIQIMGGGAHAAYRIAVQDFMAYPMTAPTFGDALTDVAETYLAVGDVLRRRGKPRGVADEGGHWPEVEDTRDALEVLTEGIELAGYKPGVDIAISLDVAATQFLSGDGYRVGERFFHSRDWIEELGRICDDFAIVSVEDPAGEDDAAGMARAVQRLGAVVVGDDFLVTDPARVASAAVKSQVGAALIKVNQAGTVTRAFQAVVAAREAGIAVIVSARSGETEDVSVAHLAAGWRADVVKVGSITRGERTAKWNELLRIDEELGGLPLAPPIGVGGP